MRPVLIASLPLLPVFLVYVGPNEVKTVTSRAISVPFSKSEAAQVSGHGVIVISILAALAVIRTAVDKGAIAASGPHTE